MIGAGVGSRTSSSPTSDGGRFGSRSSICASSAVGRTNGPQLLRESGLQALDVADIAGVDVDRSPARIERFDSHGRRWVNQGQQLFRDFIVDAYDQIWIAQPTGGLRLLKPGNSGRRDA